MSDLFGPSYPADQPVSKSSWSVIGFDAHVRPNVTTSEGMVLDPKSGSKRAFKWVFIGALLAILLASCSSNRDSIAAGLPVPDTGFYTGTVAGYNVFIWECYQGKRIVIFKTSAEMTSSNYKREESSCGETTAIEKQLATEQKRGLDPKEFWR